ESIDLHCLSSNFLLLQSTGEKFLRGPSRRLAATDRLSLTAPSKETAARLQRSKRHPNRQLDIRRYERNGILAKLVEEPESFCRERHSGSGRDSAYRLSGTLPHKLRNPVEGKHMNLFAAVLGLIVVTLLTVSILQLRG